MTLTDTKPATKVAAPVKVEADPQPDVRLSVAEQDAILTATAGETTKDKVPALNDQERPRAWSAQADLD